ncbi:hypothetical protein C0V97_06160 [Asaia sp. W19]|nr:hypothetical protein C0V97_06160 [Asaia sp. W19]
MRRLRLPVFHPESIAVLTLLAPIFLSIPCMAQRTEGAQSAGGFAPGARASASANATLDSVVGNRPSPVKNEVSLGGITYRVSPQGVVSGPDGKAVAGGCPSPVSVASGQFVAGGAPAEPALLGSHGAGIGAGKSEAVMIGVTKQAPRIASSNAPPASGDMRNYATMNASFGPSGVYVLPHPCRISGAGKQAMIADAAASLASAGGNAFALAGNREGVQQVDRATLLPGGDVMLSSDQAAKAAPQLTTNASERQGAPAIPAGEQP